MSTYKEALKELRREPLSLRNRFFLILLDAQYVSKFTACGFPLVANERCGLWYVKPEILAETAYLKSTDGHTNQWKFSFRRLNFHLLPLIAKNGGVAIVDSTRKGKLMPDALSKTVPIWCAVLNYIMFEGQDSDWDIQKDNWLRTPLEMVLESEHSSIVGKIPEFAAELKRLGLITKEQLVSRLGEIKPLVPVWRRYGQKTVDVPRSLDYFTVVCVTALAVSVETAGFSYVQGAADDHELWATKDVCNGKLDAKVFWDLMKETGESRIVDENGSIYSWLSDGELSRRINCIYKERVGDSGLKLNVTALGNTGISVGIIDRKVAYEEVKGYDAVVVLSQEYGIEAPEKATTKVLDTKLSEGKQGSKELRAILPKIMDALDGCNSIAILCGSGKDLSVGVALCLLCKRYSTTWEASTGQLINKDVVKQHLSKILDLRKVNPSRNTLQSVNTFLMGR